MNRRTILLIDDNQSTRRQRVVMLLKHGYVVRADEPADHPDGAYELIRRAMPRQRIGFLLQDWHELCQMFMDGVLTRPREELAGNLIQTVEAIFEKQLARQCAALGS
jgi:hypothetical protein